MSFHVVWSFPSSSSYRRDTESQGRTTTELVSTTAPEANVTGAGRGEVVRDGEQRGGAFIHSSNRLFIQRVGVAFWVLGPQIPWGHRDCLWNEACRTQWDPGQGRSVLPGLLEPLDNEGPEELPRGSNWTEPHKVRWTRERASQRREGAGPESTPRDCGGEASRAALA